MPLGKAPPIQRFAAWAILEVGRNVQHTVIRIEVHALEFLELWLTSKVNVIVEAHLLESDDVLNDAWVGRDKRIRVGVCCENILHLRILLIFIVKAWYHECRKQCLKDGIERSWIDLAGINTVECLLEDKICDVALG